MLVETKSFLPALHETSKAARLGGTTNFRYRRLCHGRLFEHNRIPERRDVKTLFTFCTLLPLAFALPKHVEDRHCRVACMLRSVQSFGIINPSDNFIFFDCLMPNLSIKCEGIAEAWQALYAFRNKRGVPTPLCDEQ